MKNTSLNTIRSCTSLVKNSTLRPVDIIIENGIITAIEDTARAPGIWICPAFFNAHTHLGDTVAMDCGVNGDLAALVTPPDGLKHRLLAETSRRDLVRGMQAEHGRNDRRRCWQGVQISAKEELRESLHSGRQQTGCPSARSSSGVTGAREIADGLGISSTRDIAECRNTGCQRTEGRKKNRPACG